LIYGLTLPTLSLYQMSGGDSWWYLNYGAALVGARPVLEQNYVLSTIQTPPLYLLFVGLPQHVLSSEASIIFVRIIQSLLSVATAYIVGTLTTRLGGGVAGVISFGVLLFAPVFILESGQITTETLYMFLLASALTLYVSSIPASKRQMSLRVVAVAGGLFGLATMTRAVLLFFPLGLVIHLFLIQQSRRALVCSGVLLLMYGLIVSTWTIYNRVVLDRWVIAGEGFAGLFYSGVVGWDGPQALDQRLAQDSGGSVIDTSGQTRQNQYLDAASTVISRDLPAYLQRRLSELARAYLQPHGTVLFPGESLRELAARWLNEDRTLPGLLAVLQGDAFGPKLIIYVFHYVGLVLGLLGMWTIRHQWRQTLPLIGLVAYVTLVHLLLLALPRYIFPTLIVWWVFAAIWLAQRLPSSARQVFSIQD
jgi:4-amino-4-deoxy-L-arabinose transferase-like glycosyltransferase